MAEKWLPLAVQPDVPRRSYSCGVERCDLVVS